eukprot:TRINITY_DN35361_c0_g1_i1.p2 TRINITY_DN35361_c0_g1~~TRINITY_DN35361_c0_g1_i1.p2  ORF type:complete len:195 (+),score=53.23 TRINITY_DN35361_c0_g1_i1:70-654(+)
MGSACGKSKTNQLRKKDVNWLAKNTHFDEGEIRNMWDHFGKISSSVIADGLIDKEEFRRALGLKDSLFVDRMFFNFDVNHDGTINFREFCQGMSHFSPKATPEEKTKFSFDMYDLNSDRNISKDELVKMLTACFAHNDLNINQDQVKELVEATFHEADTDGDGAIDFEEYKTLVEKHPNIISNMTMAPATFVSR